MKGHTMMLPMNVAQLEHSLQRAGINPVTYSVGGFNDECACILRADDDMWETFVGQRGQKDDLRRWDNEGDACVFFIIGMLWTDIAMELRRRAHQ